MRSHTYTNTEPQKCYSPHFEQGRYPLICAAQSKFKYAEAARQNVLYDFVSVEVWKRFLLTNLRAKRPANHQGSVTVLLVTQTQFSWCLAIIC